MSDPDTVGGFLGWQIARITPDGCRVKTIWQSTILNPPI